MIQIIHKIYRRMNDSDYLCRHIRWMIKIIHKIYWRWMKIYEKLMNAECFAIAFVIFLLSPLVIFQLSLLVIFSLSLLVIIPLSLLVIFPLSLLVIIPLSLLVIIPLSLLIIFPLFTFHYRFLLSLLAITHWHYLQQ
jgi:hypothetical protein